jgi:hypothetical protein
MTKQDLAISLFVRLREWLAFRDGYSSYLLSTNIDQWSKSTSDTRRIEEMLSGYDLWKCPSVLFRVTVRIWRILRSLPSDRAAYDALKESAREDSNEIARLAFAIL